MKDTSPNSKSHKKPSVSTVSFLLLPISICWESVELCLSSLCCRICIISIPLLLSGGSILGGCDSEKDLGLSCNFPLLQPWLIY